MAHFILQLNDEYEKFTRFANGVSIESIPPDVQIDEKIRVFKYVLNTFPEFTATMERNDAYKQVLKSITTFEAQLQLVKDYIVHLRGKAPGERKIESLKGRLILFVRYYDYLLKELTDYFQPSENITPKQELTRLLERVSAIVNRLP